MRNLILALLITFYIPCNAQSDNKKLIDSLKELQRKNDKELEDILMLIQLNHDIYTIQGKEDTLLKKYPVIDSLLQIRKRKSI